MLMPMKNSRGNGRIEKPGGFAVLVTEGQVRKRTKSDFGVALGRVVGISPDGDTVYVAVASSDDFLRSS